MRHLYILPFAAVLLLGACGNQPAPPADPDPMADAPPPAEITDPAAPPQEGMELCNAEAVQGLVGQEGTEEVLEQARIDSGSTILRSRRPDEAATMDFRPDRLDVILDENGMITELHCG